MHSASRPSVRRFTGFSLALATMLAGGAAAGTALGSSAPAGADAPVTAAVLSSASLTAASRAGGPQAPATARASGGTWGTAKEVPGTAALNRYDYALTYSVSCGSAGNCSAGGQYTNINDRTVAFVANEKNGTWGTAKQVPGIATLSAGDSYVASVSCVSAGNCGATGLYTQSSGFEQVFVVSEAKGAWGTAKAVPGIAALNKGGVARVYSMSCGSAGNCSLGGYYTNASGDWKAFVASEKNGTWGAAKEIAGSLSKGLFTLVYSVSCGAAGWCTAAGYYTGATSVEAFVADEVKGTWGAAREVAGSLNTDGLADISSVSCASAGNCSAGGFYTVLDTAEDNAYSQAFVVSETDGVWGIPVEVPGIETLDKRGGAEITSVSCHSAGNCSAGGYYVDGSGDQQAFVVSESIGIWRTAKEIAGTLNKGASGPGAACKNRVQVCVEVSSVSCGSVGNCSAGGYYLDRSGRQQAFVVTETNGSWGTAEEVAGALNKGGSAAINSLSCASASHCSGGGNYADRTSNNAQAFVVNKT
jgi:hypothetical protein